MCIHVPRSIPIRHCERGPRGEAPRPDSTDGTVRRTALDGDTHQWQSSGAGGINTRQKQARDAKLGGSVAANGESWRARGGEYIKPLSMLILESRKPNPERQWESDSEGSSGWPGRRGNGHGRCRQERPAAEEASAAAWLSRIWGCAVSPASSTIPDRAGRPDASERSLARSVGEDERDRMKCCCQNVQVAPPRYLRASERDRMKCFMFYGFVWGCQAFNCLGYSQKGNKSWCRL